MSTNSIRAFVFSGLALLVVSSASAQSLTGQPITGYGYGPAPATPPLMEAWTGFGGSNQWYGGWAGFNYALNPAHNVWTDGLIFRGEGGAGHYDYTTANVPGGRANVTYEQGALLLGYRAVFPFFVSTTLTGYVGAEVQNHDNPDPVADVRGTEWGVKFLGEIYSRINPYMDFYGQASFSTAFDTWSVIARPAFLVGTVGYGSEFWIGPDLAVFANGHAWGHGDSNDCPHTSTGGLGSCHYEEGRVGGLIHIITRGQTLLGDVLIAGGYRTPMGFNSGANGYYAQINFYWPLR
jgi:Cellulose biosynthesis protein BcsS